MADRKGDGVFVAAVLVVVAMMLAVVGFGGLGGARYSQFALLLLLGAGGMAYFALKGAESFGIRAGEGALLNGAVALAGALAFISLLLKGSAVLSSIAAAVALACAAPLVAIAVRSREKPVSS